jgi:two-component system response regulator YesN
MPGVDGFALAEHARRESKRVILVAHTGHDDADYRHKAKAVGIEHYLVKPADPAQLQRLLQSFASARAGTGSGLLRKL